jgi:hypothetical protein
LRLRTWWINKKPRIDLEIDTLWRHFHLNETTRLYKITLIHSLFIYKKRSLFWTALCIFTTRFHSFTDENISSVCDSLFIGNFITDDITDGNSPSAFLSSVIPHSIAKAVCKKKKTLTMVLQTEIALQKKKFPLEIYRRIYSVGECMQYRQTIFIDKPALE